MREIKFRAWDKDLHRMILPYRCRWQACNNSINCELMQYTGLKDMNGKEIYEGDIVKTKWEDVKLLKVIFSHGGFTYVAIDDSDESHNFMPDNSFLNGCEVIGNIYENPELLDK